MNTELDIKQSLKQWIAKTSPHCDIDAITDNTAILEQRIITSMQIMDLILYLESLTNQPVHIEQVQPGVFSSINSIYNAFFVAPH